MDFFFAINIFLIFFSVVECRHYNIKRTLKMKDCRLMRKEAVDTMVATRCYLRPEHIELKPEKGFEYQPRIVSVNRCNGVCMNKACVSKKSVTVKRVVREMRRGKPETSMCAVVDVKEDTECECQCNIQPENCDPKKQEYDPSNCSCKCKNREEKRMNCEKDMGMKWIDELCECRCMMMNMTCSSGETWNSNTCKCVPMNNMID